MKVVIAILSTVRCLAAAAVSDGSEGNEHEG